MKRLACPLVMGDEDEEDDAPLNFQRLADLCKQVASDSATSIDANPSSRFSPPQDP